MPPRIADARRAKAGQYTSGSFAAACQERVAQLFYERKGLPPDDSKDDGAVAHAAVVVRFEIHSTEDLQTEDLPQEQLAGYRQPAYY